MMFHFTRVNPVDGFQERELNEKVTAMKNVLDRFLNLELTNQESEAYVCSLLEAQEEKGHWSVFPDWDAPADVRVSYIYEPTYLACAYLMAYKVRNSECTHKMEGFDECLHKGMEAAVGRKFFGAFGSERERFQAVELFLQAGLLSFMRTHVDFCPAFFELVHDVLVGFRIKMASERLLTGNAAGRTAKAVQNKGETIL